MLNNLFHSRTKFLLIYHSFLLCFQTRPYYILFYTIVFFVVVLYICVYYYCMAWETTGICSCVVNIFVVAWNEYCIAERIICLCCVYGTSVGFICHYTLSVPSILLKQWFYYLPDEKWNRFELGWRQYEISLTWSPNAFTEIKSDPCLIISYLICNGGLNVNLMISVEGWNESVGSYRGCFGYQMLMEIH